LGVIARDQTCGYRQRVWLVEQSIGHCNRQVSDQGCLHRVAEVDQAAYRAPRPLYITFGIGQQDIPIIRIPVDHAPRNIVSGRLDRRSESIQQLFDQRSIIWARDARQSCLGGFARLQRIPEVRSGKVHFT